MKLKVGHICGHCEKTLDEDDVSLMDEKMITSFTKHKDMRYHNHTLLQSRS